PRVRTPRRLAGRPRVAAAPRGRVEARDAWRRRRLARGARAAPPRVREHGVRAAAPAPRRDAVGTPAARVGRGTRAGGPRAVRGLRVRRAEARARRPRSLGASGARGLRPGRPPDADVVRDAGDVWTVRWPGGMRRVRRQTSDVRLETSPLMSEV